MGVTEVFENKFIQNALSNDYITIRVNPSGVQFLRFDVKPNTKWLKKDKTHRGKAQELGEPDVKVIDLGSSDLVLGHKKEKPLARSARPITHENTFMEKNTHK